MTFTIGQTVGPYTVVEQLGQGGMATVYKAFHANLNRYVAIKVLHIAFSSDEGFQERFKREAQIVGRLDHPHIVPIFDYAMQQNQPYLVMKFIEGQTLKQDLRGERLNLQEVTRIMAAVADALDYAHRQDILHRDVKPSNIVIDKDGIPYLTDFGLARIASSGESTLSQDMMLGTPQYISPEQAQGRRDLGPSTDIYSLGVVLYELVVGRVPFTADTPYAIIHDHIYKPLPLPSKVNPSVPEPVERVLLKALAKNPEDRFRTAGDMIQAFKSAITEGRMSEISRQMVRPEAFLESNYAVPQTPPGYTGQPMPQMVSAPMLPGQVPLQMTPTGMMVAGSSATRKNKRRSTGTPWALGGCFIFICTCLISSGLVLAAIGNPRFKQNGVSEASGENNLLQLSDFTTGAQGAVRLKDAQALIETHPDDPAAYFVLALAQLDAGDRAKAEEAVQTAISLNPTVETVLQAAEIVAERGYDYEAATLYAFTLAENQDNALVRNEAGSYLYTQATGATAADVIMFCDLLGEYPDFGLFEAILGQALISSSPTPRRASVPDRCPVEGGTSAEELIVKATAQTPEYPEAYLVLGNYYEAINNINSAKEQWNLALALPNAPGWVRERVQIKLSANE
ncbi:MAG: protein kinase [Chloroflexi bacterium]|nr:protein kinase [Chloroflexota bacterium]